MAATVAGAERGIRLKHRVMSAFAVRGSMLGCALALFLAGLAGTTTAQSNDLDASAAAKRIARCGTFGKGYGREGVYIARGTIRCSTAKSIMKAVHAGKGRAVDNNAVYYRGFYCGGRMGSYYCQNTRPYNTTPTREFFTRSCAPSTPGCPRYIVA